MALDKAQVYVASQLRKHGNSNWGDVALDDEGKALQAELEARQTVGIG